MQGVISVHMYVVHCRVGGGYGDSLYHTVDQENYRFTKHDTHEV